MENDFLINPHDKFLRNHSLTRILWRVLLERIPDDTIRGEIFLRVLFLTEKYIGSPKLFDKLSEIFIMISNLSADSSKTKFILDLDSIICEKNVQCFTRDLIL
jgi:hypothetical protein